MRCSIVIATYNHEMYLRHVLHSIWVQNVPFEYEVIIVDDGSKNKGEVESICSKYDCDLVQLSQHENYRNPGIARNVGLKRARGEVVICQSDEVVHHTWNAVELLVNSLVSGIFIIANVWNGIIEEGGSVLTPELDPVIAVRPDWCYTGSENKRPFFFLGSVFRKDIYSVGGNDEEFTEPGWEDNWLASCLENGAGLRAVYFDDIKAFHLDHPRVHSPSTKMMELFERKCKKGIYCSSGGSWRMGV